MNYERRIFYTVEAADGGLKLSSFLRRKGFSRQNLVLLKQEPCRVLVEGEVCHFDRRVTPGEQAEVQVVECENSPGVKPVELPLRILWEDEDLIVLDKPAGMPVHPSQGNRDNTLANALAFYYRSQGLPFVFRCCNRLDRDTSGVIVVARHAVSACILSQMGTRRELSREYLAIVRGGAGDFPAPEGIIDAPIARVPGSLLMRRVDFEKGEEARTRYRVVTEKNGHTLLWLKLDTGRTHQIRVHLKFLGSPLIGDYLYHPDMREIGRQALHSWRMSFVHPITGEPLSFTVPLPEDMARILE